MATDSGVTVSDNAKENRYEARVDGEQAGYVEYQLAEPVITFTHTEVDPAMEGKGVGSALARHVLEAARDAERRVVPECAFISGYIDKHPEFAALVQPGDSAPQS